MELISFFTTLYYLGKEKNEPITTKIRAALTGTTETIVNTKPEPDVNIVSSKDKTRITWNRTIIRFKMEGQPNQIKCIENMLNTLTRINNIAPINTIFNTELQTCWILPTPNYNFPTLARKYKDTLIAHSSFKELFVGTFDYSVLFDAKIGDCQLRHQSGPMEPSQLTQVYLSFKHNRDFPGAFIFLFTRITCSNVVEYNENNIKHHVLKATEIAEKHSNTFQSIWGDLL